MRILYSVQSIQPPLTGVGRYAYQLARGLEQHPALDELAFFAGHRKVGLPDPAQAAPSLGRRWRDWVPFKPLARRAYHALRDLRAASSLRALGEDYLFHEPNYILGPYRGPSVITIHDLSHLHFPQFHPADRVDYFNRELPASVERAEHIITVSHFVRQEIIKVLGVAPERVSVTYNGVDPRYRPAEAATLAPVLARYGLADLRYLLVVGTLEPRKNLQGLIEAYESLPAAWQQQHPLVLAGARGWGEAAFLSRLERLEQRGRVLRLGYVPEADLPHLYAGASGFAFPSVYEGFGLPALEALACGVPTLVGSRSSLPEVVGEAALVVDTLSHDALRAGLERLMGDEAWRAEARQRGPARAAEFTWARCVEDTVAVYRQAWQAAGG